MKRRISGITVGLLLSVSFARAVLPPDVYAERSEASKIKAIAKVYNVKSLDVGKHSTTKEVSFKLEHAVSSSVPKIFTARCESVETAAQKRNSIEGGTIYFYPRKGQRVYVTVAEDGGMITSMTPLTPELEKAIKETPEKIRYGMSKAYISGEAGPVGSPVMSKADLQGNLMAALGDDDAKAVQRLIAAGADVNEPLSGTGQTPVMMAESPEMLQFLLSKGADIKATDAEGGTVLHYAVSRPLALELLPICSLVGVDANAKGWGGQTALHAAVAYLAEKPLPTTGEVLVELKKKSASSKDPVEPQKMNTAGFGEFPSAPTLTKEQQLLDSLIMGGADKNATDADGNTALILCTMANKYQLVEYLLDKGADKTIKNKDGATALSLAKDLNHGYLAEILK